MKIFVYGKIKGEFIDKESGELIQYYKICAVKPAMYCESKKGFNITGSDVARFSCSSRAYESITVDNNTCRGLFYNAEFDERGKLVALEPVEKSK